MNTKKVLDIQTSSVGFIGCGAMGGALIRAVTKVVNPKNVFLLDHNQPKVEILTSETGAVAVKDYNELLSKKTDYLFLASKPPYICEILTDLYKIDSANMPPVIISVAAGITLTQLQQTLSSNSNFSIKNLPTFVRLMPNTPAQIGEGMIALCVNKETPVVSEVKNLLAKAGCIEQVPEKLMDAVTAISGSGPAYVYMFIEALADAAVAFGMPRSKAYIFAAQTVKGSAAMVLETGIHPGALKDAVCSPAGTTIAAVETLEKTGMRSAVIQGARASFNKSCKMSNN